MITPYPFTCLLVIRFDSNVHQVSTFAHIHQRKAEDDFLMSFIDNLVYLIRFYEKKRCGNLIKLAKHNGGFGTSWTWLIQVTRSLPFVLSFGTVLFCSMKTKTYEKVAHHKHMGVSRLIGLWSSLFLKQLANAKWSWICRSSSYWFSQVSDHQDWHLHRKHFITSWNRQWDRAYAPPLSHWLASKSISKFQG